MNAMTGDNWGMANGFYAFVSNRHGKFYVSFAPMRGDTVLGVAIMGPYAEREAEKLVTKGARLLKERMTAGEALHFVDVRSIPADVRAYITDAVTAEIKHNPDAPVGSISGKVLQ